MGLDNFKESIVTNDMGSPHDIEQTYSSDRGEIYGTVSDKKMYKGFKQPKQGECHDNLYFIGGTVNPGGGMPMVTHSGQQVVKKLTERDMKK